VIDGFGFDVELIYVAHLAGLALREIPVRWDHCAGSKVSVTRDSWRMFNDLRLIRRYASEGHYRQAINAAREAARHINPTSSDAPGGGASSGDTSPELAATARKI
jgi:hypothetical protein